MADTMTLMILLVAGLAGVVAVSGWLSWIDFHTHRLPNRIVGPLALGVAIWILALGLADGALDRALGALLWGCAGCGVFFVLHLTAGLGMGDVKYAWPVTATLGWFGWSAVRIGLLTLLVTGAVVGVAAVARGRGTDHRVAYGPCMAVGLVAGIAYGLAV